MGTDIHLTVVARTDNAWDLVPHAVPDWERDIEYYPEERNYNLFAFLAGVRNGFGFGGVRRHEPIEPAFEDRRFPPHLLYFKDEGYGDHSHTWATVKELRELNWEFEFEQQGMVDPETRAEWEAAGAEGPPPMWSGWTSQPGATVIHWKWKPLVECGFRRWLNSPEMHTICAEHGGAENVVVIMSFDS